MRRIVIDIEASGLLDETAIDYTTSPYKLKESFVVHCAVAIDIDTKEVFRFAPPDIKTKLPQFLDGGVSQIIAANGINYDLMVLKLYLGLDYSFDPELFCGRPVKIEDTLVLSKVLNPDREGHSIEYWGKKLGYPKMDWRAEAVALGLIEANAPRGAEFQKYHPRMMDYCEIDAEITARVYSHLLEEWGDWKWESAYSLEKTVAWIITRQEHRGFKFDVNKARECVTDLDNKMQEISDKVNPVLPPKPIGKTAAKEFIPPKTQFLKNGEPSTHLKRFVEKHSGTIREDSGNFVVELFGKTYDLPLPYEPVVKEVPATIDDTTYIKGWLVGLSWEPTQWKDRDLTVNTKKQKLDAEKYKETVERYVEQTLASPFCKIRCEHLGCKPDSLMDTLLNKLDGKPVKVLTNPQFTVGQEKELCPDLERLADKFEYARDIVSYLTYKHRRNSILGGGFDPDEDEEAEKGYLANVRADGRIATPADTCGAATSRMKHRLVANVPRITSLYGEEMRSLFGVDDGYYQIGYDFDSLEAREEAHYCHKYPGGPEYGKSLTEPKPNDVHSVLSRKITATIGRDFPRAPAKNLKYGVTYGAQVKKVAKMLGEPLSMAEIIFNAFWEAAAPLKGLKDALTYYWKNTGEKKFILGIDGRKVPTRSAHAILNSLFQSAGVICAKRAMVLHDKKIRDCGLSVDFFKDDWKNKAFGQQLIAYHDEAQSEASKSLVQFKAFNTEEEAKGFDDGRIWSEVIEAKGKFYRAYCKIGELAVEAVREAGEYYKLKVPLTAGYNIGKSWKDCH